MRSRADTSGASSAAAGATTRSRIELALRITALAVLIFSVLSTSGAFSKTASSLTAPAVFRSDSSVKAGASSLVALIKSSLLNGSPDGSALRPLHLLASQVPSDTSRALLTAARLAGIPVTWTDSTKRSAIAMEVRSLIDPKGGYTVRAAAPDSALLAVRDSLGLIDSVAAAGGGGSIVVGRVAGSVTASTRGATARAIAPPRAIVRRVLVFAEPGWEGKFTVAALEERGWNVGVRFAIGKNVSVTQGAPVSPDTSRYAAVVALDSSALPQINAIRRYAATGGGVVIAGVATTLGEFGAMLPGRPGNRQPGVPGGLETENPLVGLGWRPITPDSNSTVIARSLRGSATASAATIVARRFGAGRVVESGYDGLWEWRMAGPDGSMDAHRAWWSDLVSAVAFAPEQSQLADGTPLGEFNDVPGPAAPYADTRDRLGRPLGMPTNQASAGVAVKWELVFFVIALLCLLAEWGSRRLRGAK